MGAKEWYGWEMVDELLANSTPDLIFRERFQSLNELLPFVRFPLLPYHLLKKVCRSWIWGEHLTGLLRIWL